MRLTIVSAYGDDRTGGIETSTGNLARVISERASSATWVHGCERGSQAEHEGDAAAKMVAFERITYPIQDTLYSRLGIPMPLFGMIGLQVIRRSVRESDAVIIADAYYMASLVAVFWTKFYRRQSILVQHVGAPAARGRFSRVIFSLLEWLFVRPAMWMSDTVVYVSRSVEKHFVHGLRNRRGVIIGHGVDGANFYMAPWNGSAAKRNVREALGLEASATINLYVGRFTQTKGLETIRMLAASRPMDCFVLVGDGPIKPEEWMLPNVVVLGNAPAQKVADIMRASDRFVLSSASESYSLVVREALACGLRTFCGQTIVDADPTIAPHVTTVSLTQGQDRENADRFARAFSTPAPDLTDAAAYVRKECAWTAVADRYVQLLAKGWTKHQLNVPGNLRDA